MFYLGIDISKAKLDCCLLLDEQGLRKRSKVTANSASGITTLLAWLKAHLPDVPNAQIHVIMESSGTYHQRPASLLHQENCTVSIANPSHVRHLAKGMGVNSKNDTIDSHVLARYGQMLKPQAWQPPSQAASTLSALLDRRQALNAQWLREQARYNKTAEGGIVIDLVQQSLQCSLQFLQAQIKIIDDLMEAHIESNPNLKADRQLLQSIPSVGERLSIQMLQLFTSRRFNCAQQAAAYAGVIPVQRQSGTSLKGQSRLSKAGPAQLRATLYMGALIALRRNPHIKAHYDKLVAAGRCKSVALGAAMRKLVHLCFGVLRSRQPYRADYVNAAHLKSPASAKTINQPSTGAAPVLIGA